MLDKNEKDIACHEHCYDEEDRKKESAVNMNIVILNKSHSMVSECLLELEVFVDKEIVKTEKEKEMNSSSLRMIIWNYWSNRRYPLSISLKWP